MSTPTTTPKLIFVDGFNTVGKNYFIDELKQLLPTNTIVTDPRIWLPTFQQNQRHWDFNYRNPEELDAILKAHLHHLQSLHTHLCDDQGSDRVIISNRSFVSAVNYNFLPNRFNGKNIGGNDEVREELLALYSELINLTLPSHSTLMVNLCRFHNGKDNTRFEDIQQIKRNQTARTESEQLFNDFYLDYLIHSYQNPSPQVKALYSHWEDATSADAIRIVQKYFG